MTRCSREYRFRDGKIFRIGDKTKVMGILNLSIDSFSDRKIPTDFESMQKKILQLIDDGADIIDIGAQSTRPGYVEISTEEEIDRLRFLPELVKMSTVPISIDTYREEVAEFAFVLDKLAFAKFVFVALEFVLFKFEFVVFAMPEFVELPIFELVKFVVLEFEFVKCQPDVA